MANILGDSIIINKNYIIDDNSLFENYIIPSSPFITESILMVLPKSLREDSNCFCVWNYSPYSVILQYRYGAGVDEIYILLTIKSMAIIWVEHSSMNNNFSIVGSKALNDSMILN